VNVTLSSRDVRLLHAALGDLIDAAPASLADTGDAVIGGRLPRLIGCDLTVVTSLDDAVGSDPAAAASRRSDAFAALRPFHPILRHRARTGALDALTFDDVIDRRVLVRGEVFNELFRPYGWNETLNVRVLDHTRCDISFGRVGRPFGSREQVIADLARSCLHALWTRPGRHRQTGRLTRRQGEILALVADGFTNGEIAERLHLAPGTVKRHLDNIYAVLGVHTRTAAARFADAPRQE
jgi:DNA-binding CsgD family transcriptional regulator